MKPRLKTALSALSACALATVGVVATQSTGQQAEAAVSTGTTIHRWQTSQAGDRLSSKSSLTFSSASAATSLPTIQIDPTTQYQSMDGFGGTFNEAGWTVLQTLSSSARDAVMTELFDQSSGAGFSLTRVPLGASDFACTGLDDTCPEYTDDDISSGTDFNLDHFSIARDQERLIPFVQAAKAKGDFKIVTSPWSAPAWMKTNNSLDNGGSVITPDVDSRYYQTYAKYFEKFVQAWGDEGVPIDYVSVQNEPQNAAAYASTSWTSSQMADFVGNYLGPLFEQDKVDSRIRIYDHNRDTWEYPKEVLDDSATAPYVAGVDFHDYECTFGIDYCLTDNIGLFNQSHPDYSIWMSEHTDVDVPHPSDYLNGEKWGQWIMDDVNAGVGGYIYWNLVLDQNGGPVEYPKSAYQDPLVDVDTDTGQVYYMPRFWYLAQFSKFVRPGATRIGTSGGVPNDNLSYSAFKNPDGSEALVVLNSAGSAQNFTVNQDGQQFTVSVDAHSINTFTWTDAVDTYHVIAGSTSGAVGVNGDHYTGDAHYTGGGVATNDDPISATADDALYQPERNGDFSYSFPVPDGRYKVTLKFSENYWTSSGSRKFNVALNGSSVLTNYDIYADTGARYKAVDKTFTTTATSGSIGLTFTSVTDKAKVDAISIVPLPSGGSAYKDVIAPAYVPAADYNTGGEGVAYHFSGSGGTDTTYRTDATHLETCSNDPRCGDDVGWLSDGDWINYTVNVAVGGNYDIGFRTATPGTAAKVGLDVDGIPLVSSVDVATTTGYQDWTDTWASGINLTKGVHTFKVRVVTGGFNFEYLQLKRVQRLDALPATVEAEWYNGGGEGVGYHDTTSGDELTTPYKGYFRADDVDLEISSTHGYDVGRTADGEWLRYDVWNPTAAARTFTFAVASEYTSGQIRIDLDTVGNTLGSTLSVPDTGGWQDFGTVSESVSLPAGTHTIYVYIPTGGFNLNYFTIS